MSRNNRMVKKVSEGVELFLEKKERFTIVNIINSGIIALMICRERHGFPGKFADLASASDRSK